MKGSKTVLFTTGYLWHAASLSFHRLAVELARRQGWRVVFVEGGVSVASPIRDRGRLGQLRRRVRRPAEDFIVLAPLAVPPQASPGTYALNARLRARAAQAALQGAGWSTPDVIFTNHPQTWRLARSFPGVPIVFHVSDAPFRDESETRPGANYVREYERLWTVVDAAVAVSPPLRAAAEARGVPTVLIPHGVDYEGIRAGAARGVPDDLARLPAPRVGYIGRLAVLRIDWGIVRSTAEAHPDWSFAFIGGSRSFDVDRFQAELEPVPVGDLANVYTLGEKRQEDLGAYMAGLDVGWVPYVWDRFNTASNPLKVMEYLAGGLPVVASGFDALEPLAEYVTLVEEGGDFVGPLERGVRGFSGTGDFGDGSPEAARQARLTFASRHTWADQAEALAGFFDTLGER